MNSLGMRLSQSTTFCPYLSATNPNGMAMTKSEDAHCQRSIFQGAGVQEQKRKSKMRTSDDPRCLHGAQYPRQTLLHIVDLAQALVDPAGAGASADGPMRGRQRLVAVKVAAETPLDQPDQGKLVEARGELHEEQQGEQCGL